MVRIQLPLCGLLVAILMGPSTADAQATGQSAVNADHPFSIVIAPLLARRCVECHATSSKQGGLDLSTHETLLSGGDSGAAIVPGKPSESLVWQAIAAGEMPKDRPPLSEQEQAAIKTWIERGAVWEGGAIDPFAYSSDARAGYDWWSLRPPVRGDIPQVHQQEWPRTVVDSYVLANLEAADLRPAPEADRRTLIRRLYFDLIGLPPTPAAVRAFIADDDPLAYEKIVDELLESPHYGERWARHWLDVVRFGETQGYERNLIRENAWRYRDWVIEALNQDLPYDEFIRRQIAGDVLTAT